MRTKNAAILTDNGVNEIIMYSKKAQNYASLSVIGIGSDRALMDAAKVRSCEVSLHVMLLSMAKVPGNV